MGERNEDMPGPRWRAMTPGDVPGAIAVADVVHPGFPEGPAMYLDRIALFGAGCLVLASEGRVLGYALAYPARYPEPVALDRVLGALPADADALYVHDVALLPEARGGGRSREAVERLLALAEPFGRAMLVSVYGTAPFWSRFGFREDGAASAGKLASYGPDAVFMSRRGNGLPANVAGS